MRNLYLELLLLIGAQRLIEQETSRSGMKKLVERQRGRWDLTLSASSQLTVFKEAVQFDRFVKGTWI